MKKSLKFYKNAFSFMLAAVISFFVFCGFSGKITYSSKLLIVDDIMHDVDGKSGKYDVVLLRDCNGLLYRYELESAGDIMINDFYSVTFLNDKILNIRYERPDSFYDSVKVLQLYDLIEVTGKKVFVDKNMSFYDTYLYIEDPVIGEKWIAFIRKNRILDIWRASDIG